MAKTIHPDSFFAFSGHITPSSLNLIFFQEQRQAQETRVDDPLRLR